MDDHPRLSAARAQGVKGVARNHRLEHSLRPGLTRDVICGHREARDAGSGRRSASSCADSPDERLGSSQSWSHAQSRADGSSGGSAECGRADGLPGNVPTPGAFGADVIFAWPSVPQLLAAAKNQAGFGGAAGGYGRDADIIVDVVRHARPHRVAASRWPLGIVETVCNSHRSRSATAGVRSYGSEPLSRGEGRVGNRTRVDLARRPGIGVT